MINAWKLKSFKISHLFCSKIFFKSIAKKINNKLITHNTLFTLQQKNIKTSVSCAAFIEAVWRLNTPVSAVAYQRRYTVQFYNRIKSVFHRSIKEWWDNMLYSEMIYTLSVCSNVFVVLKHSYHKRADACVLHGLAKPIIKWTGCR